MLVKKLDTRKISNSDICTVWEYDFPSKNLGIATALIDGKYPESDWVINEKCDMIHFVISGSGTIYCGNDVFKVAKGDAVFVKKGVKYKVVGNNLEMVEVNAPAWFPDQYKSVK